MGDDGAGEDATEAGPAGRAAGLHDTAEGRSIAAEFIELFGRFVSERVRPVLRDAAAQGGEPQELMDGLADLLRDVADSIDSTAEGVVRPPRGSGPEA